MSGDEFPSNIGSPLLPTVIPAIMTVKPLLASGSVTSNLGYKEPCRTWNPGLPILKLISFVAKGAGVLAGLGWCPEAKQHDVRHATQKKNGGDPAHPVD